MAGNAKWLFRILDGFTQVECNDGDMDGEAMGSSMPEYTTWRVEDCDEQKGGMGVNP